MLHVICTQMHPGHLSVRVGDSSRRSEEIVKKTSRIAAFNAFFIIFLGIFKLSQIALQVLNSSELIIEYQ